MKGGPALRLRREQNLKHWLLALLGCFLAQQLSCKCFFFLSLYFNFDEAHSSGPHATDSLTLLHFLIMIPFTKLDISKINSQQNDKEPVIKLFLLRRTFVLFGY